MTVKVRIPEPMRRATGGLDTIEVRASNLAECLDNLEAEFPGIKARLCDDKGELHSFVNIYVNSEDVHYLQELATPLSDGDEVTIVPAIAGG